MTETESRWTDWRLLTKAEDVTPDMLEAAVGCLDWFPDGEPMPEDDFIDRLCRDYLNDAGWEIEQLDTPATRKIMRHARAVRRGM